MTLTLVLAATALMQTPASQACPVPDPPIMADPMTILSFESGSAQLSSNARRNLDGWRETIRNLRFPPRIELTGNTDRVGSRRTNLWLSFRRARAVRDYLVRRGIPRDSIRIRATGEQYLVIETPDGVAEAQNRIVWFLMVADEREPRC